MNDCHIELIARAMCAAIRDGDPDRYFLGEPYWRVYVKQAEAAFRMSAEICANVANEAALDARLSKQMRNGAEIAAFRIRSFIKEVS